MCQHLKEKQTEIVDNALNTVNDSIPRSKCFFIDGSGGTGKILMHKTLYYIFFGQKHKIKCTSFTVIAPILLPDGSTPHKAFGLKVPSTSNSISNIKPRSTKGAEFSKVEVFLMDETPKLPKYGLHHIDKLPSPLRNLYLPFSEKVTILIGDFRQCLSAQLQANQIEILHLSIKKSELWHYFNLISLT